MAAYLDDDVDALIDWFERRVEELEQEVEDLKNEIIEANEQME